MEIKQVVIDSRAKIIFNWTRAHVGTLGNERADQLAKLGGEADDICDVQVPKALIKEKINDRLYSDCKQDWTEYEGARMAKLFYSGPDKNLAKHVYKLTRMELSRFVRITSGHNGLFYFKSKIDPEINPECRFCLDSDETFYHFVTDCPKLRLTRENIFLDQEITNDMKWSVKKLLNFSTQAGVRDAIDGDTSLRLYESLTQPDSPDSEGIG